MTLVNPTSIWNLRQKAMQDLAGPQAGAFEEVPKQEARLSWFRASDWETWAMEKAMQVGRHPVDESLLLPEGGTLKTAEGVSYTTEEALARVAPTLPQPHSFADIQDQLMGRDWNIKQEPSPPGRFYDYGQPSIGEGPRDPNIPAPPYEGGITEP
jgi:hypothetical protein